MDYYEQHAERLTAEYRAIDPEVVHGAWYAAVIGEGVGTACDIGAGSGRDADWLAERGWDVLAVEPSDALRHRAVARCHPRVHWRSDTLPELRAVRAMQQQYDLLLLSAVWQHLDGLARFQAMPALRSLLAPGGVLVVSLRHGRNAEENRERGFYPLAATELIELADAQRLSVAFQHSCYDPARDVDWETLVFTHAGVTAA